MDRQEAMKSLRETVEKGLEYLAGEPAANIEKYRKGEFTLTLTDREGKPMAGVPVRVEQQNHAFRFGANLFMLDELETAEKNELYRKNFASLWRLATLPFYWRDVEPEQGKNRYAIDAPRIYRRPNPELCLQFCKEAGIEPKAHCLMYDNESPAWAPRNPQNPEEIKPLYEKRFAELAERFAHRIPSWEVTNETLIPLAPDHTPFHECPGAVEWSWQKARQYFPDNHLIINEAPYVAWNDVRDRGWYYMQIRHLLAQGATIDAIGMQFHIFDGPEALAQNADKTLNPARLLRTLDLYGSFRLPTQITEITVPTFGGEREAEQLQADIITMLYRTWFSHPSMEAIIYWNSLDGYAFGAKAGDMESGENVHRGGLFRYDLSEKPSFTALRKLLKEEWHTSLTAVTDENGVTSFRGFRGDYTASFRDMSCGFTLGNAPEQNRLTLSL